MLANKLKILLAERNLRIKDVVENTNVSRNTVSNIINNPYSNISNKTLDEICNFLNTDPKHFFVYAPYIIEYSAKDLSLNIKNGKEKYKFNLKIKKIGFNELGDSVAAKNNLKEKFDNDIEEIETKYSFFDLEISDNKKDVFMDIYKGLPYVFQEEITQNIIDMCKLYLSDFFKENNDLPKNSYISFFNGEGLRMPKDDIKE